MTVEELLDILDGLPLDATIQIINPQEAEISYCGRLIAIIGDDGDLERRD